MTHIISLLTRQHNLISENILTKNCINFHLFSVFLSVCTLTIALTASMASPANVNQEFAKAANSFATELYQVGRF